MGKGRLTTLDVRAIVRELKKSITGSRVNNFYNINKRTYLFKLSAASQKTFVLVESGVRVHTTEYLRDKDTFPNSFSAKLRKHIRYKRVESVQQLGVDRNIVITFGAGDSQFHVILELYSQGNIILTNHENTILMALREYETDTQTVKTGEIYPLNFNKQEMDLVRPESLLKTLEDKKAALESLEENKQEIDHPNESQIKGKSKKKQKPRKDTALSVLSQWLRPLGKDLVTHALLRTQIDVNTPFEEFYSQIIEPSSSDSSDTGSNDLLPDLVRELNEAYQLLVDMGSKPNPGYIVSRRRAVKKNQPKKPKKKSKKTKSKAQRKFEARQREKAEAAAREAALFRPDNATSSDQSSTDQKGQALAASTDGQQSAPIAPESPETTADEPQKAGAKASANNDEDSKQEAEEQDEGEKEIYHEFLPLLLAQHDSKIVTSGPYAPENCTIHEYPSFCATLDEFFSKLEQQAEQLRLEKEKNEAWAKVERVRTRHQNQINDLQRKQRISEHKAELIQMNIAPVEEAMKSVNTALAEGTDWNELEHIIDEQREIGNPVARMIDSLKLNNNAIVVTLSEGMLHLADPDYDVYDSDEDGKQRRPVLEVLKVELDLSLTPFQNATQYYQFKKKSAAKCVATTNATDKALKAAEKKTETALRQVEVKHQIRKIRKVHWFEKFHWFITSENYLVIGGRDAPQNEIVVKRYLQKNDIYVHTTAHGAPSVIVKNPSGGEIPPLSLVQAGQFCVCHSSAWKNKVVTEAYWVHADQVSKTAPTGLFIPTGSFMVRGKRNFLPRNPLVMGFAIMFRISDECVERHRGERRVRGGVSDGVSDTKASGDMSDDDGGLDQLADGSIERGVNRKRSQKAKKKRSQKANRKSSQKRGSEHAQDLADWVKVADPNQRSESGSEQDNGDENKTGSADAVGESGQDMGENGVDLASIIDEGLKRPESGVSGFGDDLDITSQLFSRETSLASSIQDADFGSSSEDDEDNNGNKSSQDRHSGGQEASPAVTPEQKKKGGRLSKAERRRLKRIAQGKSVVPTVQPIKEENEEDHDRDNNSKSVVKHPPAPAPLPRGKRSKTKRNKKNRKYQEQDEEDRERARQLLGIQLSKEEKAVLKEKEDQERKENEEQEKNSASPSTDTDTDNGDSKQIQCYLCKQFGHILKNCPSRTDDNVTFRQLQKDEDEEISRIRLEEGDKKAQDDAQLILGELDTLTGQPREDDVLQYAIPMCAPLSALNKYKFKVKLLPGTGKKGKTSKAIQESFCRAPTTSQSERDLLRGLNDGEVHLAMLSNVKLGQTLGGRNKGGGGGKKKGGGKGGKKQKQKQGKKKGKKK